MLILDQKAFWKKPKGGILSSKQFLKEVMLLISQSSRVYIGTDSMVRGDNCVFVTVIAFHDNNKKIAKFFYKKIKLENSKYRNLKNKIIEEVSLSMQAAQKISNLSPNISIELHVDIGKNKKNKTKAMMSIVAGWVNGMGYDLKVKPESWASSSIADSFTK